MDIQKIVAELKQERERLNRAIAALEGINPSSSAVAIAAAPARKARRRRGGLTAEGRKRLSELMRKRWAERRKKVNSK